MATPLGLETLTTLSATEPLFANDEERAQAVGRFRRIVGYFEPLEKPSTRYGDGYNHPALVRLTFDFALARLQGRVSCGLLSVSRHWDP